jgi:hypothetical protein
MGTDGRAQRSSCSAVFSPPSVGSVPWRSDRFLSPANDPDGPGESRKKRFGIPSAFTFILGSDSGRAAAASSSRDEANRLVYKQHEQRTVIGCRCSRPADYATGADEKRC